MGFRVRGSGFGVFHVRGFAVMGFEVSGVGFEVLVVRGLRFVVSGSGFPRFGVCGSGLLVRFGGSRFSRFGVPG